MYQILMPPDVWSNDKKRNAYLEMRNALIESYNTVYERPITRSMSAQGVQPVVTITPPKKPTVKRSYKSLKHIGIESKNMFMRLFGWVLTSAGALFGQTYDIEQLEKNAEKISTKEPDTPSDMDSVLLIDEF